MKSKDNKIEINEIKKEEGINNSSSTSNFENGNDLTNSNIKSQEESSFTNEPSGNTSNQHDSLDIVQKQISSIMSAVNSISLRLNSLDNKNNSIIKEVMNCKSSIDNLNKNLINNSKQIISLLPKTIKNKKNRK